MSTSTIWPALAMALALSAGVATWPAAAREVQPLDEAWRFSRSDPASAMQPGFDDSAWRVVRVPHDWSMEEPFRPEYGSGNGYAAGGLAWYRRSFTLKPEQRGQRVRVEFDGVYSHAQVWLNGQRLGGRAYGYSSFHFDITPYLVHDRPNVLAVRVDRSRQTDSRYFSGSGIYRQARLVFTDAVHIAPWGVFVRTPQVGEQQARVWVDTELRNEGAQPRQLQLQAELLAPDGRVLQSQRSALQLAPGESRSVHQRLLLQNPQRWHTDAPWLYTLRSRVMHEGRTLDEVQTPFGVREARFSASQGFTLNGQAMKLRGVALHHDAGSVGAAVPVAVLERRLRQLQALGVNAIRTSHNPPSPELLDLCDRLGLLVQVEAFDEFTPAKNKWVEGWNLGLPSRHGYAEDFGRDAVRDVQDMVRRDRNHPSVVMWSIGNEIDYPNDPFSHPVLGAKYRPHHPPAQDLVRLAKPLVEAVRALDATRPVTAALAHLPMAEAVGLPALFDVVGYNYQEQRYAEDHARFPQRVIYGSENRHDHRAWVVVRDTPYIAAQFLWTGFDYLGEAGRWPQRAADFGLFDLAGFLKPRGAFRESLWSTQPVVHVVAALASAEQQASTSGQGAPLLDQQRRAPVQAHWNWSAGAAMDVSVYANTPEVQLWLNGRLLGSQAASAAVEGVLAWRLPFEPGELRAVGLRGGQPVASAVLRTAGPAARVELRPQPGVDGGVVGADGVVQVEFHVVDAAGVRVPDAQHRLQFELQGPLHILGIGNGDLADLDPPGDDVHAAYQGRGLAVLRRSAAGDVQLRVSAPGLEAATWTLPAPTR